VSYIFSFGHFPVWTLTYPTSELSHLA